MLRNYRLMVSNEKKQVNLQVCLYPPKGYRSFGPIRASIYGGSDYAKHADQEILKLAMIETKESLEKLDEILDTPNLDGIYIGPADLSLALGEEPGFDKPESTKAYQEILRILESAKKRNLLAGLHNGSAEYAQKMIEKGFNLVTVGSDSRYITSGAKSDIEILKGIKASKSKGY